MPVSKKNRQKVVSKLGTAILRVIAGLNIASVLVLWFIAACQYISPLQWTLAGVVSMTFPFVLVTNLLFLPFWLIIHVRFVAIPVVGLLCCIGSILNYTPVTFQSDDAADLRLITSNVHMWQSRDTLENWLLAQQADVILTQEDSGYYADSLYASGYEAANGDDLKLGLVVYSRLPILESCSLNLHSDLGGGNGAVCAKLLVDKDTLYVVNVHLESYNLQDQAVNYRDIVENPTADDNKSKSRALVQKLCPAQQMHAQQIALIKSFVDSVKTTGCSVIVAGDFNDVPNSYTCHVMRSVLTDCYRTSATGPGFTFHENLMYFRIDHVFCDDSLEPLRTRVAKDCVWSDHYPLISDFKWKGSK